MKTASFMSILGMVGICFTSHADISTIGDDIERMINEAKIRCGYYKPYAISGMLIGAGTAMVLADRPSIATLLLASAGAYGLYAWQKGLYEINALKKKYSANVKVIDYWRESKDGVNTTLFSRWRQDDDFSDGMYWPTAWWMSAHKDVVKRILLQDIYSGKITVIEQGKVIDIPTPEQVIKVILAELKQLEQDKHYLKRYTDIYRSVSQPEAFNRNQSLWRFLWPNYNNASRLYVEIVIMMQRLDVLREIVASLKAHVGGNGWPRLEQLQK